jgi:hypothetical protein
METLSLELPLRGPGAEPRTALVEIAVLEPLDRLKRAGSAFGVGLAAAALALLIPIVHFVLVPSALLLGFGIGIRRLGQGKTFRGGAGSCPYCGAQQQFTLLGRFHLPKAVYCASCQRELYLDEGPATISPPRSPT